VFFYKPLAVVGSADTASAAVTDAAAEDTHGVIQYHLRLFFHTLSFILCS
jgi:hypothetical protein